MIIARDGEQAAPSTAFYLAHLTLCSLAWGSSFLLIKLVDGALSPLAIAAVRGVIAALAMMTVVVALGQIPLPRRQEILPWLVIGLFNGSIPNFLVAYALQRLDSGPAALIQSAGPLITAAGAHLLFPEERLNVRSAAGVFAGLIGVALLIGPKALEGSATALSATAMLGVACCYTIGNLYTRTIRHHHAARLALGQQMFSAITATSAVFFLNDPVTPAAIAGNLWPLLGLGLVATGLPMLVFMRMIVRVGPTRAALTGYTVPTVATILGVVVLGERLTLWQIAGGGVVFLGVWLVALSRRKTT